MECGSLLSAELFFFFFSPLVKLSWSKKMVRKWFNIKSKTEEFQADDPVYGGRFFLFFISLLLGFSDDCVIGKPGRLLGNAHALELHTFQIL